MAQKTGYTALGLPGQIRSFIAKTAPVVTIIGKVTATFTVKTPKATFTVKTPKATFEI